MAKVKQILFLGVGLYNYDIILKNEISKNYKVYYIAQNLLKSEHYNKWFILNHLKMDKKIAELNSQLIFERLQQFKDEDFSFVFVIKGSRLNQTHLDYINNTFPNAKKILYLWDSWDLTENRDFLQDSFPTIYTFDPKDSIKYGFIFRPLFYLKKSDGALSKNYDVSFVGTNHSDRLEKLRQIKNICHSNGLSYLFRLKTTYYPLLKAHFGISPYETNDLDIITNKSLNYEDVLAIINQSKCVVDFAHPSQCGLTMRTLESLAAGCKIITSNKNITEYKDIHPSWYYVIDKDSQPEELLNFINTPCQPIDIPERYSICSFINDILR